MSSPFLDFVNAVNASGIKLPKILDYKNILGDNLADAQAQDYVIIYNAPRTLDRIEKAHFEVQSLGNNEDENILIDMILARMEQALELRKQSWQDLRFELDQQHVHSADAFLNLLQGQTLQTREGQLNVYLQASFASVDAQDATQHVKSALSLLESARLVDNIANANVVLISNNANQPSSRKQVVISVDEAMLTSAQELALLIVQRVLLSNVQEVEAPMQKTMQNNGLQRSLSDLINNLIV